MDLSLETTIGRAADCVSADVAGETVIMCVAKGNYYALDKIGSDVWARLATPRRIGELCNDIKREYDAPLERIERDVLGLLGTLAEAGLVEVSA